MARFDRLAVLNAIVESGLVPVFYHNSVEVAKQIVGACAEGGARVVEFTNRGDRAWNVFTQLAEWAEKADPEVILGVGSVIDAPTAALYIASGANFVVGPILNPEVARLCNRRKIAYMPGCGSATRDLAGGRAWRRDRQGLPRRRGRRAGVCQGCACADALDADHAHRRRRCHGGEHPRLVSGRRGVRWHRLEADYQRDGGCRGLGRHLQKGRAGVGLDP